MPTIDGFLIPEFICKSYLNIIETASDIDIQVLAKTNPELSRGLRPTKVNNKIIRQRLQAKMSDHGPLDHHLQYVLANSGFNLEFIAILSEQVLTLFITDLVAAFGATKTLGALLVDERQAVRDMTIDFISHHGNDAQNLVPFDGGKELTSNLTPFLKHIQCLLQDNANPIPTPEASNRQNHPEKNKHQINKLTRELKKELKTRQRLEKLFSDKMSKKDTLLTALQEQIRREQGLRQKLDQEQKGLREELTGLHRQVEEGIELQVRARMTSNIRGWLVEPQRIATAVQKLSQGGEQCIMAKTSKILREQEKLDRHYGNRRLLRQRLLDLEDLKKQVDQASEEALNPLPELSSLNKELAKEICGMQDVLGEKSAKNPWHLKLESLINQAATQVECNAVRRLIEQLEDLGLLNDETQQLNNLYHNKLERLYERYSPKTTTPVKSPIKLIQNWLGIAGKFILVADGYNIIMSLPEFFSPDCEQDGTPGPIVRQHLLQVFDKLLNNSKCQAEVFFDSEKEEQRNFSPQVRENFSGGGSREVLNRADTAIIDYLTAPLPNKNIERIIITDDRELQTLARQQQARIMPLAQFATLLPNR